MSWPILLTSFLCAPGHRNESLTGSGTLSHPAPRAFLLPPKGVLGSGLFCSELLLDTGKGIS